MATLRSRPSRVSSTSAALEQSVLASRFNSWQRKSNFRPMAPPAWIRARTAPTWVARRSSSSRTSALTASKTASCLHLCHHGQDLVQRLAVDAEAGALLTAFGQSDVDIAAPAAFGDSGAHDGIQRVVSTGQAATYVEAAPVDAAQLPDPLPVTARRLGACEAGHAGDRHIPPEACDSPPAPAKYTPHPGQARMACPAVGNMPSCAIPVPFPSRAPPAGS